MLRDHREPRRRGTRRELPLVLLGLLAALASGCEGLDEERTQDSPTEERASSEEPEAAPVLPPGPPRDPAAEPQPSPFAPALSLDDLPSRWRPPGELGPSPWPEGHPVAEREGGPRPSPLPPRDREGRPLFRLDSLEVEDETLEVRFDLYDSSATFPVPFHVYLPEGFAVDEIGSGAGYAVRFVDGRAPGTQGPPAVSAFLFRDEVSMDSAQAVAEDIADSRAIQDAEDGPEVAWAHRTFGFTGQTQNGWVAAANLDGRPMIWMFQSPADRRADFQRKVDLILSSWRWTDGDRPFEEAFR